MLQCATLVYIPTTTTNNCSMVDTQYTELSSGAGLMASSHGMLCTAAIRKHLFQ
jgi:hypothetical protein